MVFRPGVSCYSDFFIAMNKRVLIVAGVIVIIAVALLVAPNGSFRIAGRSAPEAASGEGADSSRMADDPAPEEDFFSDLEPSTLGDEADVEPAPLETAPVTSPRAPGSLRRMKIDAPRLASTLLPEIDRMLKAGRIPSASVALVAGDRIVWSGARGFANLRVKTPAAPDTVYLIGSTFKTLSTLALLQQRDLGKFELDDPVSRSLATVGIVNENPNRPVTFRHLLTHTSGLPTDFGRHSVWEEKPPPSLEDYLRGSLRLNRRPGPRVVYSNMAFALVAYLVETFSGVPFKTYMKTNVFDPLGMRDTAFEPRPDMAERLAIPYMPRRRGGFQAVDWVKADAWAAGVVYGTALDQARWLAAVLNGCECRGRRLLSEASFRDMTTRQYNKFAGPINGGWLNATTGYGLTWWVSTKDGETYIAHSGSVNGYTAFLAGNLDRRIGVAILTNGNKAHRHLYEFALKALAALS
jgi:CubicO group peptidase (beta-lactamase class C family)